MRYRALTVVVIAVCAASNTFAATANRSESTNSKDVKALAPAQEALRKLQFAKAVQILSAQPNNPDAQLLLGLMYLNGVGVPPEPVRARELIKFASEHGRGEAAFVLAGELVRNNQDSAEAAHELLQHSAQLGYPLAVEVMRTGKPLWEREFAGSSDPSLLLMWAIECARKNDARRLKALGSQSALLRDEFGRGALHYAAAAGSLKAGATLLELGADIGATDKQGVTPLMLAAESGGAEMTSMLLAHGASAQAQDAEHRTPTFYAARADQVNSLLVLKSSGAQFDARDIRGYNALDAALSVQANASVQELRTDGLRADFAPAPVGRQTGRIDPAHPGEVYRGWSTLALSIARADTTGVRQLLEGGEAAAARTPQGDTMLQVAADAHAYAIIPLLLMHGADPAAANHAGHSTLWLAAARTDLPLVQALLLAGVGPDIHAKGEETALLTATRAMHVAVAVALLDGGAEVQATDAHGLTPLMIAAASGQRHLLEAILSHHAALDTQDERGRTALWHAAAAGSREEAVLLVSRGATVSVADSTGLTPLHAAASRSDASILTALIEAHAPLNSRSVSGDSPLMVAAASGQVDVVQALLDHAPSLDFQNVSGDTALIAASRGGYIKVCQLLLNAGANRALRNHFGVAAADVAASRGFPELADNIAGKKS